MARIPAGSFAMGSVTDPGYSQANEEPQHTVNIGYDFYIGKFEVTQAQWQAVMGSNPSNFSGADRPVERVSWDNCNSFITALNALGIGTFRLPTEAEWEYACRAES
ncbi:MAG: formylglycine-generating enzyme family protein, partial [Candidatus Hydrogenedentes bacterium]|nr:formylglycine-generating enzyme family protein [Candidatus Hydrogenedentota bacterium]